MISRKHRPYLIAAAIVGGAGLHFGGASDNRLMWWSGALMLWSAAIALAWVGYKPTTPARLDGRPGRALEILGWLLAVGGLVMTLLVGISHGATEQDMAAPLAVACVGAFLLLIQLGRWVASKVERGKPQ